MAAILPDPVSVVKYIIAEFFINDRLSFMRFLELSLSEGILDGRPIWLFRKKLMKVDTIKSLFERFDATLREAGYMMSGQIIDASLVAAPRRRDANEPLQAASGHDQYSERRLEAFTEMNGFVSYVHCIRY